MKKFVDEVDLLDEQEQREYSGNPRRVIEELQRLWELEQKEQERLAAEAEEG